MYPNPRDFSGPSPRADWNKALCLGQSDWMDPIDIAFKLATCEICPVLEPCKQWAERIKPQTALTGVWGGRFYGKRS